MDYSYYNILLTLVHISYIFSFIGVSLVAPQYIVWLRNILQLYISIFLLYKFNPFKNKKIILDNVDTNIIFNAAILLFTSSIIGEYIKYRYESIKNEKIKKNNKNNKNNKN